MPRRYLVALVVVAILFFGGIGLLISILNRGGSSNTPAQPVTTTEVKKTFEKDVNTVIFTTYGPIVGEEEYRAIRIIVTPSERRAEVLNGYYETVSKSQTTANNQQAYNALLIALKSAGFDQFDPRVKTDIGSECVTNLRYVYEAKYSEGESFSSWSTSCSAKQGNFQGNRRLVQTLMQAQIPNYSEFVDDVEL